MNRVGITASLAVLVASILSAEATTYKVGGDSGWAKPANDLSFYSNWASGNTFHVNDILEFHFTAGAHNVAQVSEEAYKKCEADTSPIPSNPPISVTLTASSYYFICTIGEGSHCDAGQKLNVTVSAYSSGTLSPPPPPSSASRPVTALASSLVFGLLYLVAFFN